MLLVNEYNINYYKYHSYLFLCIDSMSQLVGEQLDFEYYTGYIPVGSEA